MAATPMLARGFKIEVDSAGGVAYKEIKGLDVITMSYEDKVADTTVRENAGFESHLVATRARTLKLEGLYLEDEGTGAQDAGQADFEALAEKVDRDSIGTFKLTSPGGRIWTFGGSAKMGDLGGPEAEASKWTGEIRISGVVVES